MRHCFKMWSSKCFSCFHIFLHTKLLEDSVIIIYTIILKYVIINDDRRLLDLICSLKFSWVSERTSPKINRSLDRRPKKKVYQLSPRPKIVNNIGLNGAKLLACPERPHVSGRPWRLRMQCYVAVTHNVGLTFKITSHRHTDRRHNGVHHSNGSSVQLLHLNTSLHNPTNNCI